ncbi:hypothetical protein OAC50_00720 [bacterium]|jgi:hypothetical protein|nr:hypothetical protein [bacterium]|tara:strand:- start:62 stop:250 length:189 start_codon:yes stop_codon:yes gene_type:complete
MRNRELIGRKFDQMEGKIQTLKYMLKGQSTAKEFATTVEELSTLQNDLRSIVDRDMNPLKNG